MQQTFCCCCKSWAPWFCACSLHFKVI